MKRDPRVDAYINRSARFARPILNHLRKVMHAGCPELEETLKWGFPHFIYKGILGSMASFKGHCAFGFWKGALLARKHQRLAKVDVPAMGQFGRITAIFDLPSKATLVRYIKEAVALNERGIKRPAKARPKRKRAPDVPDDLMSALRKHRKSLAVFESLSPGNQRDYVEWVTEAKKEATRKRRLETAIAWMAEGKARNWKYMKR